MLFNIKGRIIIIMDDSQINNNSSNKGFIIIGIVLVFFLIIILIILAVVSATKGGKGTKDTVSITPTPSVQVATSSSIMRNPVTLPTKSTVFTDDSIVMKVGIEEIYERDYKYERARYRSKDSESTNRKKLLDKMATDSAVLQGAMEDKILTLDQTTFNSPTKDYAKRIKLISALKNRVESKSRNIEGVVVSIWSNNGGAGALSYEKRDQIARKKIIDLHEKVKSGSITAMQATEMIIADKSLSSVDPSYRINARVIFQASYEGAMTISETLNEEIRKTEEGGVTAIVSVSADEPTLGKVVDSIYSFAQITKKGGKSITSYRTWLKDKVKKYEKTIY